MQLPATRLLYAGRWHAETTGRPGLRLLDQGIRQATRLSILELLMWHQPKWVPPADSPPAECPCEG